ncbi:hypothetical protein [Synechocystis sp. PCC 7509]|uniref:hypothetical protein n=1 Tax=Synechocystis sp. PCC 7509 TaxID=927677 RepID=UPI00048E60C4|nr:hypothetical protein [Synechocystis sp. PCC 7509]
MHYPKATVCCRATGVRGDAKWFSLQPRDVGRQVLVYGKVGKTRAIKLPASLWQELQSMRGDAAIGEPVFTSRKRKGHLKEM